MMSRRYRGAEATVVCFLTLSNRGCITNFTEEPGVRLFWTILYINGYFRYQLSTRVLDKIPDRAVKSSIRTALRLMTTTSRSACRWSHGTEVRLFASSPSSFIFATTTDRK